MSRAFRRAPLILAMAAMLPFAASASAVAGLAPTCSNSTLQADATAGGTYTLDCGSIPITAAITVASSVTFQAGAGYTPTLSPSAGVSAFSISASGDLTLKGVTVTGASGIPAISVSGVLSASKDTFTSNTDGAISINSSVPSLQAINNSTFSGNSSTGDGAAIYITSGYLDASGDTFTNNTGVNGGAVALEGSAIADNIANNTFSGNSGQIGGAMFTDTTNMSNGPVQVYNSSFSGDSANAGGAIAAENGAIVLEENTFRGETTTGSGSVQGGSVLYTSGGESTLLQNNTLTSLQGPYVLYGGSGDSLTASFDTIDMSTAANAFAVEGFASASVTSSIISGQSTDGCYDGTTGFTDGGGNDTYGLNQPYCGAAAAMGDVTGNPQLGPLQLNGGGTKTEQLLTGSAAIGIASCPAGTTVDQRGLYRPQPTCDAGAYQTFPPVASLVYSPNPIASLNSIAPGQTVNVTLTPEDAGGSPVRYATVSLTFSGGGSATATGYYNSSPVTLSSTGVNVVSSYSGTISLTYTAPSSSTASGSDSISGSSSPGLGSVVTGSDAYGYGPEITVSAPSQMYAGSTYTVTGTIVGNGGAPLTGESITLLGSNGGVAAPSPTTSAAGSYSTQYTAPQTLGPETLTANDVLRGVSAIASTNVQNGVVVQPPPSCGTATVGSLGGILATPDCQFIMPVPAGDLPSGQTLSVSDPTGPSFPSGFQQASPIFTLTGTELSKAGTATIRYNPAVLGFLSPLRTSVYYLNPQGDWEFLPTHVKTIGSAVEAYIPGPGTYVVLANTRVFPDIPQSYWAKSPIDQMLGANIMQGFQDNTFQPDGPLTRAQFTKMLVNVLTRVPSLSTTPFTDVRPNAWYAPFVDTAYQDHITSGFTATTFNPGTVVTREELAVMLAQALGLTGGPALQFTDSGDIGSWAVSSVQAVVGAGYMQGFSDGTFRPLAPVTRAQAAAVLALLIDQEAP